jgi:hypothetical protein
MALTAEQQALDYPELQDVGRQRKLADLLMASGMQQPQGQMISGYYIPPSFAQQLNPMANILASQAVGERADTKQLELASALRGRNAQDIQTYAQLQQTDPAKAIQFGLNSQNPVLRNLVSKDLETQKYGEGDIGQRRNIATGQMETVGQGSAKFRAPLQSDTGTFIEYRDPNDPTKILARTPKTISPEAAARLNQSAREFSFNSGQPMGGVGAPQGSIQAPAQAPLRTINPGSPILAPGQQVPQQNMPQQGMPQQNPMQGQPPVFRNKAEQDIYVASEKKKNELQAEAMNALPGALQTVEMGLQTINGLIGDTTVDKKGKIVYGKQRPLAGFSESVGMPSFSSGLGITNLFPGSDASNFKAAFKQIEGQAFLGAISALKGSGAISEIEGAKATAALNRMSLSQSESEFIKAANEFKTVLEKGYTAAQQRAGTSPLNPNTKPSFGNLNIPKYNAQTGQWE